MTVAFEIRRPWRDRPTKHFPKGWRPAIVTIWHVDPERDGSDDSCGWFKRARHGKPETLEKIERAFRGEWEGEHIGWFDSNGFPIQSLQATTLAMFRRAAYTHFGGSWGRTNTFLRRNLLDIIWFAENRWDSFADFLRQKHGFAPKDQRIKEAAAIIYGCILRWTLPWWRHPRWHVWHWRIEVHPTQQLKRWLFSRCATCKRRFAWGYSPTTTSWDGPGPRWFRSEPDVHHSNCKSGALPPQELPR